jgi:hypothetical protein
MEDQVKTQAEVQETLVGSQIEEPTRNNGRNRRNGRGNGFRKRKLQKQCLKIIDRRFKQRKELLPGLITLSQPLFGDIKVTLSFNSDNYYQAMKAAMERWALTVPYTEIRALKGVNGLPTSIPDLEAIDYTAKRLTIAAHAIIWKVHENPNFGIYLMNKGRSSLTLPKLNLELIHLMMSYHRLHEHQFLERTQLYVICTKFERVPIYLEAKNKAMDEAYKNFGQWKMPFDLCYNYLARLTAVTNLMPAMEMDINQLTHDTSDHCLNVVYKEKESGALKLTIGQNATEKDVCLALLLTPEITETDLLPGHLDSFEYVVPENQVPNAIKRFILNEYVGIADQFISPSTLASTENVKAMTSEGITSV